MPPKTWFITLKYLFWGTNLWISCVFLLDWAKFLWPLKLDSGVNLAWPSWIGMTLSCAPGDLSGSIRLVWSSSWHLSKAPSEEVRKTSSSFQWSKLVGKLIPESEWEKTWRLRDQGHGYKEVINWRHKSNLPQFLSYTQYCAWEIGQLYGQTCGSGRLTRAHRLEKMQRIK